MLKLSEFKGIHVWEATEVLLLMYADDIVLVGETIIQLQRKINILEQFCRKYGMKVNLDKTKVMVFRNGGITAKKESFYYLGKKIDIDPYYRYLGLILSSRNVWSKAVATLAAQADKALTLIKQFIRNFGHFSFQTSFKIFDCRILPILCYGSEIWGYRYWHDVERVQTDFCKFVLGVGRSTSSAAVLGECGRLPIAVHYHKRVIKYWLKLIKCDRDTLIYKCYQLQLSMDKQNRSCWATEVKHLLFRNGFGYAWVHQEVGNEVEFLKSFVQRITDIYKQKWFLDINESRKLSTYSQFKSLLEPEKYLHVINSFWARKHLAKFRTSNHDLAIEKGRHAKIERHMRMCNMCNLGCVEDEYHYILICPKYEYLREKYLP